MNFRTIKKGLDPKSIQRLYSEQVNALHRSFVANPNTPPDVLKSIARQAVESCGRIFPDYQLLETLVDHPNCDLDVLLAIVNGSNDDDDVITEIVFSRQQ